jgi:hypothetical protein
MKNTFAELKEVFNIFPSTLATWRKRFDESGQLTLDLIPGRSLTINSNSLIKTVAKKPDVYVHDLVALWLSGCSGV